MLRNQNKKRKGKAKVKSKLGAKELMEEKAKADASSNAQESS